jgi:hypothetical protein
MAGILFISIGSKLVQAKRKKNLGENNCERMSVPGRMTRRNQMLAEAVGVESRR